MNWKHDWNQWNRTRWFGWEVEFSSEEDDEEEDSEDEEEIEQIIRRGADKSPSLSQLFLIVEQDAVVEAHFTLISSAFTALLNCAGGGTTKSNS